MAPSDSGWSATDNRTSVVAPSFAGAAKNAATVSIFDGGTLLGTVPVVNNAWAFTVDAASPLTAGRHLISAQAADAGGAVGARSRPLAVEIITAAPGAPTVGVAGAADSGVKGDGITSVRNPIIGGGAAAGSRVFVTIDGGDEIRLQANPRNGTWSLRCPVLTDGTHTVSVQAENVAGLRGPSATLTLKIDSVRPMAKLAFIPADNAIEVTFTRPVSGLNLGHFTVSGNLAGKLLTLKLTNPSVVSATGGFTLEQTSGTVYRVKANSSDVFGGSYRISLVVPKAGIVETESGAANPLTLTSADYGLNLNGNPYCNA